jgi:hypothetical protein
MFSPLNSDYIQTYVGKRGPLSRGFRRVKVRFGRKHENILQFTLLPGWSATADAGTTTRTRENTFPDVFDQLCTSICFLRLIFVFLVLPGGFQALHMSLNSHEILDFS